MATIYPNEPYNVNISAADDIELAIIRLYLDGILKHEWAPGVPEFSTSQQMPAFTEIGTHKIRVDAVDASGNEAPPFEEILNVVEPMAFSFAVAHPNSRALDWLGRPWCLGSDIYSSMGGSMYGVLKHIGTRTMAMIGQSPGPAFILSEDGGESWLQKTMNNDFNTRFGAQAWGIVPDGILTNLWYPHDDFGTWLSRDDGDTWERIGVGMDKANNASNSVIDPEGNMYAQTEHGVYRWMREENYQAARLVQPPMGSWYSGSLLYRPNGETAAVYRYYNRINASDPNNGVWIKPSINWFSQWYDPIQIYQESSWIHSVTGVAGPHRWYASWIDQSEGDPRRGRLIVASSENLDDWNLSAITAHDRVPFAQIALDPSTLRLHIIWLDDSITPNMDDLFHAWSDDGVTWETEQLTNEPGTMYSGLTLSPYIENSQLEFLTVKVADSWPVLFGKMSV